MTGLGGLILALICFGAVGLAAGIAIATLTCRDSPWLLLIARAVAILVAGSCFLIASLHQIAEALTP